MTPRAHLLTVAYVGTAYAGWQRQDGGQATIQEELEKVTEKIWGTRFHVEGSGRTDTGVHALGQTAAFLAPYKLEASAMQRACNYHLPLDIRVVKVAFREPTFHARFDVAHKTYEYRLGQGASLNPFALDRVWHIPQRLDLPRMREAAAHLLGRHDFAALATNSGTPRLSTERTILKLEIKSTPGVIKVTVTADGFLYHMVRNLVGALVKVGRHKLTPADFKKILLHKKRTEAPAAAPAWGLYLKSVAYHPLKIRQQRAARRQRTQATGPDFCE